MNRRTLLQSAGVAAVVGLAGCIDGVQEHFGLQGIVPIEIHSEADRTYNLHLQAYDREADRQSYEQSISVTPGESVKPPNLDKTEQSFRIARIDDNDEETEVREVSITSTTQVVTIQLSNDGLAVEVDHGDDAENETGVDGDENRTVDTGGNETDENETDDGAAD
ncbi:twin-arginine translocation signal domain-containing protein [Natronorubrum halophilum]|uniref:twin-arginine translocation signal domain-containing protein n=1 Tax=Natronorubrum halophilum TaxID=1702106 RepID=UPI001EE91597|nr:twin-arginine translocation signal domain-containing protein [Natronorubrum halophilum]